MADRFSSVPSIARKEFRGFFATPAAYLFLGGFLAVTLFVFFWVETFFARNIADVRPLFEWFPLLLIFLVAWLIYAVLSLAGGGYEASRTFIANAGNAALLGLLLVMVLCHAMLGLQVVIEDYSDGLTRKALIIAMTCVSYAAAATGLFAIARIAL